MNNDDVLTSYLERVFALRDDYAGRLDEDSLRQIAYEVGMTEEDLRRAEQTANDHHVRGKGYLAHGRFDDAAKELTEALGLSPGQDDIRMDLAQANLARFRQRRDESDAVQAEVLARQCLRRSPSHDGAFQLLNELEAIRKGPAPSRGRAPLVVGLIAVGLFFFMAMAGGVIWAVLMTAPAPEHVPAVSSPPVVQQAPTPPPVQPTSADFPPAAATEFKVTLAQNELSKGLQLRMHQAAHDVYQDSAFFKPSGWIDNIGDQELSTLVGELQLFDAAGNKIGIPTKLRILESYHGPLRPGDSTTFHTTFATTAEAHHGVITLTQGERVPAASSYPAAKDVALSYEAGVAPREGLRVRERHHSFNQNSLFNNTHFKAHLEFENKGPAIRALKISMDFIDANGKVIEPHDRYVSTNSGAPILTGETRLFGTAVGAPEGATSYRLRVTSLQ